MQIKNLHPWKIPIDQAVGLQATLAGKVMLQTKLDRIRTLAGADIAYDGKEDYGYAAVIVYSYPNLDPLEAVTVRRKMKFPYVPGLLSFREGPVLLEAFAKLDRAPDLVMFDGQGVAHPRRFGLASHLGLFLDRPTIGVAKSRLSGAHDAPGKRQGDAADLSMDGRLAGYAVRSKPGAAPIYVSPGHRVDYQTALKVVRTCLDGHRIPRPTRDADALSRAAKRGTAKEFYEKLK